MCIYTYTTVQRLCMNYHCCKIIIPVKQFYTNWEWCEVLAGYVSLGRQPGGDWANMWHWTKCFTIFFSNRSSSSPSYFHIFFLIAFLKEAFIRNTEILLCINCIIIIHINDNNAVINNNYERLQDLNLLFKVSKGKWEDFFEMYGQFGHAPSERFASPVLDPSTQQIAMLFIPNYSVQCFSLPGRWILCRQLMCTSFIVHQLLHHITWIQATVITIRKQLACWHQLKWKQKPRHP